MDPCSQVIQKKLNLEKVCEEGIMEIFFICISTFSIHKGNRAPYGEERNELRSYSFRVQRLAKELDPSQEFVQMYMQASRNCSLEISNIYTWKGAVLELHRAEHKICLHSKMRYKSMSATARTSPVGRRKMEDGREPKKNGRKMEGTFDINYQKCWSDYSL